MFNAEGTSLYGPMYSDGPQQCAGQLGPEGVIRQRSPAPKNPVQVFFCAAQAEPARENEYQSA